MTKIKNRCCYTVTLILCGTLFLTGLTGCKSTEAQFLIDGLQEAKAEVDAESSEEKTSGQKSKKDTDDRQNDDGSSAESRKKQAESDPGLSGIRISRQGAPDKTRRNDAPTCNICCLDGCCPL